MISKAIEAKYDMHYIKSPRLESLPYWQRIIEDLTYLYVAKIDYNEGKEYLVVTFDNYLPKLLINIRLDSLQACTRDVITRTIDYMDKYLR